MSDLVVTDFNDFFISFDDNAPAKEQETVKDKKLIALKVLVIVLGSFLVLEALLYSFVLPLFSAPEITYSGLNYLTKNELNEKLSELDCSTWSGFSTETTASPTAILKSP